MSLHSKKPAEAPFPEPMFRLQHYSNMAPRLPLLRTSASSSSSSNASSLPHAYILLSGLGDTLGTLPYIPRLANHLASRGGWELLLPTLSSTGGGWGTSSLEGDARELCELITFLRREEEEVEAQRRNPAGSDARPKRHIVIHGHSTGCQDLVQLLSESRSAPDGVPIPSLPESARPTSSPIAPISAAIFQAPVSDCEDFQDRVVSAAKIGHPSSKQAVEMLKLATEMVEQGRGNELLPRSHVAVLKPEHGPAAWSYGSGEGGGDAPVAADPISNAPVTAYRHHSLHASGGDDDFFSSARTLTDEKLRKGRLARAIANAEQSGTTKLLFLFSAQDEYVPPDLRKDADAVFFKRWEGLQSDRGREMGTVRGHVIEGAGHAVHDVKAQIKMLEHIDELLDRVERS
ncbi:hypothetical protein A4X13_0g3528 [Tilletia indica]|uniref:AB hydrolase-1 domain-containing protein n=1 Tax=Tilletia indica TaxID=43049 RepID=A0A177T989_9BASI|nr:hypothetical protein A4X13_0g3528 [Tilletia indica]